ncbi:MULTISPECIES: oligoribonuclease [Glutamicibacter]|uniref:Oligoribonuclease n=1 Tax=Glutamicibacter creatinolyticus TaxID=162496 RepID=A0A5B7WSQ3_9MICC|nr:MULTISPECIES: oligoribonuclease [Glutamicibacter]QCY47098.1 Oligoribonuclease [Glutamicibacter creatinolyticus]
MASNSEMIVWIDCEMTGLNLESDALIEVAVLITDAELNVLDEGISVVIKPDEAALEQMDDFVRDMHIASGLLPELAGGMEMDEAQKLVLEYITARVPEPKKALLGGNSVGMDKNFLARDMPAVIDHLHYRVIDVSTIKELARRWYTKAHYNAPVKTGNHRALGDIQDSIDELKYYRGTIMVPSPGPTSVEAAKVARQVSGSAAQGR